MKILKYLRDNVEINMYNKIDAFNASNASDH